LKPLDSSAALKSVLFCACESGQQQTAQVMHYGMHGWYKVAQLQDHW
jgi:hypothetical protein